jgi:hypothetical protein
VRIDGSYLFPAPAERLFATLLKPGMLARTIQGAERIIQLGPLDDEGVAFKAWIRGSEGLAVLTLRFTSIRRPESLRLAISGHLPGGRIQGSGVLDLVAQDNTHTRGAYALTLETPEDALDVASAQAFARTICERLAGLVYTPPLEVAPAAAEAETPAPAPAPAPAPTPTPTTAAQAAPHSFVTPLGRIAALPMMARAHGDDGHNVTTWTERMLWMGAGLALGLAAVSLILAVAQRFNGNDT